MNKDPMCCGLLGACLPVLGFFFKSPEAPCLGLLPEAVQVIVLAGNLDATRQTAIEWELFQELQLA
jgi:hypothetical protein